MTQVRKISGKLNNGLYSIESANVTLQIDSIPKCNVVVTGGSYSQIVNKSLSDEAIVSMRKSQQKRLAGVTSPDAELVLYDGQGNKLNFNGYFVAPALGSSKQANSSSLGIVGVDAAINSLDMSIYVGSKVFSSFDAARVEAEAPSLKSGNVTGIIKEISEALRGTLPEAIEEDTEEISKEITRITDANNKPAFELWKKILDNSEVKIEALEDLLNNTYKTVTRNFMLELITNVMQGKVSGFWSVVQTLMEHFKMFYIPNTEGSGMFKRRDIRVSAEPEYSLMLSAGEVGFNDGSESILQLGGVVMMMSGGQKDASREEGETKLATVAAIHPEPFLPGYIHREPAPQWLIDPAFLNANSKDDFDLMVFDLDDVDASVDKIADSVAEVNSQYHKLLKEMCRVVFKDLQLSSASAGISIPLDFSVKPGARVNFKIGETGESFTGFISSITHRIQLVGGTNLVSGTQLNVTHVRF